MKVKHLTASAAALVLFSASAAIAQQAPATTTTTTTTTTAQTSVVTDDYGDSRHILSGAVGGVWGGDSEDTALAFDGAYNYLYNDAIGFEFIGAFTPEFALTDFPALQNTSVSAFMFNAITALPLGGNANWMPFISGGVGMFRIRDGRDEIDLDVFDPDLELDLDLDGVNDSPINDNQFGGNIGVGVMAFADRVGFRADVRYYTGMGNNEGDREFISNTFSDISYWRSTAGVSFRW